MEGLPGNDSWESVFQEARHTPIPDDFPGRPFLSGPLDPAEGRSAVYPHASEKRRRVSRRPPLRPTDSRKERRLRILLADAQLNRAAGADRLYVGSTDAEGELGSRGYPSL